MTALVGHTGAPGYEQVAGAAPGGGYGGPDLIGLMSLGASLYDRRDAIAGGISSAYEYAKGASQWMKDRQRTPITWNPKPVYATSTGEPPIPPQYNGGTYDPNVVASKGTTGNSFSQADVNGDPDGGGGGGGGNVIQQLLGNMTANTNRYLHGRDPRMVAVALKGIPELPHPINGGITSDDVCLKCCDYSDPTVYMMEEVATVVGNTPNSMLHGMLAITPIITRGTNFNQRIGNCIWTQNISIKFSVTVDSGTSSIRYLVVYDKQPNNAYTSLVNIIAMGGTSLVFNAYQNYLQKTRFIILRDRTVSLCGESYSAGCIKICEEYVQCNLPSQFFSIASVDQTGISAVSVGNIYFIAFLDPSSENEPSIGNVCIRQRFRDCAY